MNTGLTPPHHFLPQAGSSSVAAPAAGDFLSDVKQWANEGSDGENRQLAHRLITNAWLAKGATKSLSLSHLGLKSLPECITQLDCLTSLNLRFNDFDSLPDLSRFPQFTKLNLGLNEEHRPLARAKMDPRSRSLFDISQAMQDLPADAVVPALNPRQLARCAIELRLRDTIPLRSKPASPEFSGIPDLPNRQLVSSPVPMPENTGYDDDLDELLALYRPDSPESEIPDQSNRELVSSPVPMPENTGRDDDLDASLALYRPDSPESEIPDQSNRELVSSPVPMPENTGHADDLDASLGLYRPDSPEFEWSDDSSIYQDAQSEFSGAASVYSDARSELSSHPDEHFDKEIALSDDGSDLSDNDSAGSVERDDDSDTSDADDDWAESPPVSSPRSFSSSSKSQYSGSQSNEDLEEFIARSPESPDASEHATWNPQDLIRSRSSSERSASTISDSERWSIQSGSVETNADPDAIDRALFAETAHVHEDKTLVEDAPRSTAQYFLDSTHPTPAARPIDDPMFRANLEIWAADGQRGENRQEAAEKIIDAWTNGRTKPHLNLSGLKLRSLPDCIVHLEHIKTLDLCGNALTNLPDFSKFARLEELICENRFVSQIKEDAKNRGFQMEPIPNEFDAQNDESGLAAFAPSGSRDATIRQTIENALRAGPANNASGSRAPLEHMVRDVEPGTRLGVEPQTSSNGSTKTAASNTSLDDKPLPPLPVSDVDGANLSATATGARPASPGAPRTRMRRYNFLKNLVIGHSSRNPRGAAIRADPTESPSRPAQPAPILDPAFRRPDTSTVPSPLATPVDDSILASGSRYSDRRVPRTEAHEVAIVTPDIGGVDDMSDASGTTVETDVARLTTARPLPPATILASIPPSENSNEIWLEEDPVQLEQAPVARNRNDLASTLTPKQAFKQGRRGLFRTNETLVNKSRWDADVDLVAFGGPLEKAPAIIRNNVAKVKQLFRRTEKTERTTEAPIESPAPVERVESPVPAEPVESPAPTEPEQPVDVNAGGKIRNRMMRGWRSLRGDK